MRFDVRALRRTVLDMAYAGKTGHIACAFSLIELLAVLYRSHLSYDPKDPMNADRDYLVLSKGHGVMAQYACLAEIGWISPGDLGRYCSDGTRLTGLADPHVPGVEASTGSLGHGLSVAVGLAMAAKRRGTGQRAFAVIGDGELNEGAIWEALLFAAHFRLDNLIVLVDENGFQAMGRTEEVMRLGDLPAKFSEFGFDAADADGHDEDAIDDALHRFSQRPNGKPKALVAHTVKGKGVSFMENDNRWHYTRLTSEAYERAKSELAGVYPR